MALATEQMIIMMPPKTASTWLRATLNKLDIHWWLDGTEHGMPASKPQGRSYGMLVRDPAEWLRSYYCYRYTAPMRLFPELDEIIDDQMSMGVSIPTDRSFASFIHDVVTIIPGFVSRMYLECAPEDEDVFMIPTNNIGEALGVFLSEVGYGSDITTHRGLRLPKIGQCPLDRMPAITSSIETRVMNTEPMEIYPGWYD